MNSHLELYYKSANSSNKKTYAYFQVKELGGLRSHSTKIVILNIYEPFFPKIFDYEDKTVFLQKIIITIS
jgi:hypothetical protein